MPKTSQLAEYYFVSTFTSSATRYETRPPRLITPFSCDQARQRVVPLRWAIVQNRLLILQNNWHDRVNAGKHTCTKWDSH